jgi:hypothetical protein
MDGNRIISLHVQYADLQHRTIARRSDDHCQIVIHGHQAYGVTDGMPDVRIGDAMLASRPTDPHADNLPCLKGSRHPEPKYRHRERQSDQTVPYTALIIDRQPSVGGLPAWLATHPPKQAETG